MDFYIDGRWMAAKGAARIPVENPATEEIIGEVAAGTADDIDAAVQSARRVFPDWSNVDRLPYLLRLHGKLAERADEIARTITLELGAPIKLAQKVHTGVPLKVLQGFIETRIEAEQAEQIANSTVIKEPVGVVGAITPWNYPLHQIIAKLGAALAAGCTVVLKPAELTPLTARLLFEAIDEAGFPPGVVNLVTGTGPEAGAALAAHSDVDMVSFTGSTKTGAQIAHLAADRIARVSLELGGKSANVILEDADLVKAAKVGVANAFLNSGQTCTAWTRMLVAASRYREAVEIATASAAKYTMGDPFDETTRLGPLVSAAQRDRVANFIGSVGKVPERGYFVAPTVIADVDPDGTLAQEEIFGPVLVVMPFRDDDEAVQLANNSRYGLSGAVWSEDEDRAMAVARRMRTGGVDINGGAYNPLAPFGGYKQSGYGREFGRYGVEEFLQTKAIQR